MRDGKQRRRGVRKAQASSSECGSAVRSGRGKLRKLLPQKNCLQTHIYDFFKVLLILKPVRNTVSHLFTNLKVIPAYFPFQDILNRMSL